MAAIAALAPLSAMAQVSCTPVYGGGSQCADVNGPINPASGDATAAGRAAARTDSAGLVAPTYGGYPLTPPTAAGPPQAASDGRGSQAPVQTGSLDAAAPNFDSYFTASGRPAADPTAAPPAGSYRTTNAAGKVVTCVPVESGGYRCT